jgi:hypothetical protein
MWIPDRPFTMAKIPLAERPASAQGASGGGILIKVKARPFAKDNI